MKKIKVHQWYVVFWARGGKISIKESKDKSVFLLESSNNADSDLGPFTTLGYEIARIETIRLGYVVPKKSDGGPSEGFYPVLTSLSSYLQSSKFDKKQSTKHLRFRVVKL